MSKQIDLSRLLSKGSAKQRAALLIYHYTILEAIELGIDKELKPILTDVEAKAIFESFKDNREARIYNEYKDLNHDFIITIKHLYYTGLTFERDYWKYLAILSTFGDEPPKAAAMANEGILLNSYSRLINYYTALKVYAKERGYTNKFILKSMDKYLEGVQEVYKEYIIKDGSINLVQHLNEIEPDYEEVKKILQLEFNYKYEKEPE